MINCVCFRCDLLEKKLRSGVRVKDYVPSFGGRKNDVQTVTQCEFFAPSVCISQYCGMVLRYGALPLLSYALCNRRRSIPRVLTSPLVVDENGLLGSRLSTRWLCLVLGYWSSLGSWGTDWNFPNFFPSLEQISHSISKRFRNSIPRRRGRLGCIWLLWLWVWFFYSLFFPWFPTSGFPLLFVGLSLELRLIVIVISDLLLIYLGYESDFVDFASR